MIAVCFLMASVAAAGQTPSATSVSFTKEIAPIFAENCLACHNAKSKKGRYDMSSHAALLRPGKSGKALAPGKPDGSLLFRLIAGAEEPAMPKDAEPLDSKDIARIKRWIADGAKFDGADPSRSLADLVEPTPRPTVGKSHQSAPVTALAFTADGNELAVAGYRRIDFRAAADGKLLRSWPTQADRIHALAFRPDGKKLLHAGGRPGRFGEVVVWDAVTGKPERVLLQTTDVVFAAAWSADGKRTAAGGVDRTLHLWEADTGKQLERTELHADWIFDVGFLPKANRILSASRDRSLKVWDVASREVLSSLPTEKGGNLAVGFSKDGNRAYAASLDGQLHVWSLKEMEGHRPKSHFAHAGGVYAVKVSANGEAVATAGADKRVRLWNAAGDPVRTCDGHADWVLALAFTPDGKTLASGGHDGAVWLWEVATGKRRSTWRPANALAVQRAP